MAPGKPTYEELEKQVADLAAKLEKALAEIERLKRGGRRQATPFSKGERKVDPRPPGRKPGEGPFRFRAAPPPEAVSGPALPALRGRLEMAGSETV